SLRLRARPVLRSGPTIRRHTSRGAVIHRRRVVNKLLLLILAVSSAALLAAGRAASDPVFAGQCGIAAQQTVWGEYGWPSLLPILARPGTLLAVTTHSGTDYAAAARARGAATYAFDLGMKGKVGTPTAPADPSTIAGAA